MSPPFVIPPWQYVSLKVSGFGGGEGNQVWGLGSQRPSLPVSSRTILLVLHGFVRIIKPNKYQRGSSVNFAAGILSHR